MSPERESPPASAPASAARSSLIRRHGRTLTALFFCLSLFGGYQMYAWQQNLAPLRQRLRGGLDSAVTFLPFDLVNYLAGFLRVSWRPFILTSALGSLPGTLSFVLLGASVGVDFSGGNPALEPWVLLASGILLVGSLVLSRYLKRRGRKDIREAEA